MTITHFSPTFHVSRFSAIRAVGTTENVARRRVMWYSIKPDFSYTVENKQFGGFEPLFDVTLPEITRDASNETYGRYRIEPLQPGWGTTLGASLRRILMSSLTGAAVTAIRLADMPDDPSEVPGIEENLMDLVLNVKQLRFRVPDESPSQASNEHREFRVTLRTDGKSSGERTAADLELPQGLEVVDPELFLVTATGKNPFE